MLLVRHVYELFMIITVLYGSIYYVVFKGGDLFVPGFGKITIKLGLHIVKIIKHIK